VPKNQSMQTSGSDVDEGRRINGAPAESPRREEKERGDKKIRWKGKDVGEKRSSCFI